MVHFRTSLPVMAVIVAISILGYYLTLSNIRFPTLKSKSWWKSTEYDAPLAPLPHLSEDSHPIIRLLHDAETNFDQLVRKETRDVASAAWIYREKRGRHPPPGFERWHQYALDHDAIIVEEFWDQIYHDLSPLWALNQSDMRQMIRSQEVILQVRDGVVTCARQKCKKEHFWTRIWQELVGSFAKDLPDLDMALNTMDEPRLLISWEEMAAYMQVEQQGRGILPVSEVTSRYSGVPYYNVEDTPYDDALWNGAPGFFERARLSCPPDSAARVAEIQKDFSKPPIISTEFMEPHMRDGYVSNFTLSTSICHQPDLEGLHGALIEPISLRTSDKLFPLFGSSKLTVNSEILIPAAMYYKGDARFENDNSMRLWSEKSDTLFWRGLASGGRNKEDNWKGFHRHRLVSMLNGTQALLMPNNSGFIDVSDLPVSAWDLEAWKSDSLVSQGTTIGNWLNNFTDAGFTGLACFPKAVDEGCSYTNHLFKPLPHVDLYEQHNHKYLVDVDGNSFSGRYRDFLMSGSLPIKATLFREWHDSRLVAWKHFVPLDNRFLDLYGIMEFFLGYPEHGKPGRDELAMRIARQGHLWAEKVLRKEDMRIYMYRLLLEYARIMDDTREILGWTDDLL